MVAGNIYEINGTIVIAIPIELNGCEIAFYIYKNNVKLPSIKVLVKIGVAAVFGTVTLATNDYIALWVENQTNLTSVNLEGLNI